MTSSNRQGFKNKSNRRWLPPPPGTAKINVDAAVSKNLSVGSAAAVARNSNGGLLGASLLTIEGMMEPEMLEAVACREKLALGK